MASFESAKPLGAQIRTEALLRGARSAKRLAVVGDGALWRWKLAEVKVPQARQILDFYHTCQRLRVLADALLRHQVLVVGTQPAG